jgi:hypothetical protein
VTGHLTTDHMGSSVAAATVDVDLLLGSDKEDGPFPQLYWVPSTTVEITMQQKR